ncbi:MAG: STN domain-containing protein, partial [Patescibacteria group bacterium]|nr:STN domain-containing protein [Patescibacteria group bacterium]
PLQIKVEHVAAESAARVMVRDAAANQVVSGAQVNVIDSTTGRSIVGKTDLRGVFVAEEIAGPPTVIVKDEPSRYSLHQAPAAAMHAGGRPLPWVHVARPGAAAGGRFGIPLAEDKNTRIRQALAAPISLEFVETPLQDVVDYLKNATKIEIQIDRKSLDDVGVATDMPVTKNLRNVSLKSALRLMLRELGLTYSIEDEVLLITTPEEAENRLETRMYPVTDLVRFQDKKGEAWTDFDSLIELITSTVKPQTWDEVGGPGSIAPLTVRGEEVIVLSQTEDVHEELDELIARLRKVGKLPEDGTLPVREPQQWDGPQAGGFGGMGGFGGAPADAAQQPAPILQPGAGGKAELLRGLMEAQRELQGAEADQLQQMYEKGKGISGMGGGMF